MVVKLATKGLLLEGSMEVSDTQVLGNRGGWVKEDNSTITDKSLWDEEW